MSQKPTPGYLTEIDVQDLGDLAAKLVEIGELINKIIVNAQLLNVFQEMKRGN